MRISFEKSISGRVSSPLSPSQCLLSVIQFQQELQTTIIPDESLAKLLDQFRPVAQYPSGREEKHELWLVAMLVLLISDWFLTCVRGAPLVQLCRQANRH